jgi:two-component system osmolarity sensor histidine kinase EnvZ
MASGFLKRALPRGFYGRAALILIVPIISIQLVVSVMFLQRHFEDVTSQMTRTLARDLALVLQDPALSEGLDIILSPGVGPTENSRPFYDLSGRVVTEQLRDTFPQISGVDLATDDNWVTIGLGDQTATFARARVSASNPHQLLVLMVVTSLVMTLVAFLFMRNQIRPLRRLARVAEAFGRGRSLPYTPAGATEVRAAGTAFLNMRQRIERHIDQRTLLLSGVSHDLRTPLTRMRLELSMMDPAESEGLQRDVDEMAQIIDTFLDFAREAAETSPTRLDACAFARSVVEDFERGGDVVTLILPETSVIAPMQASGVQRALSNLIKNGFRYGAKVRLTVQDAPGALRFVVEDNGPGIPEADRARATRPFTRLDAARSAGRGSVGLGLAIVTDVARSHGGTLVLGESPDLGGLRAELVLPK